MPIKVLVNLLAGMAAYAFYDTKPSINMELLSTL